MQIYDNIPFFGNGLQYAWCWKPAFLRLNSKSKGRY